MPHKLALHGGRPVRTTPFPARRTMGAEERAAVLQVMDSGVLSAFIGNAGPYFEGGEYVKKCEREWADYFGYKHAITVNSWTSGLVAAVGATGVGPGDEVITSPYTMSASATCALAYGAVPVFADVEPETFGLDPASVRACVTERTKAIVVVHLFGHPARMKELQAIADEFDLALIEDAAQSPGAEYMGRAVGALRDIGGFSLNYHKHIHCGEGGVLVTNDDELALRCQLIRNHGEAVVEGRGITRLDNVIGWNFRLTELQAAIASAQLPKLQGHLERRRQLAARLSTVLAEIPGLTPPQTVSGCTHSFYVFPIRFDESVMGISRSTFVRAIHAELPKPYDAESTPLSEGYVRPLYLQPIYQGRLGFGSEGFPFRIGRLDSSVSYESGICPVTERLHERELLLSTLVREPLEFDDIDAFAEAFIKVAANLEALRAEEDRAAPALTTQHARASAIVPQMRSR
jgi:perosamine synthetase